MKNIIKRTLPLLIISFLAGCVSSTRVVSDNATTVASIQNISSTKIYFSCEKSQGDTTYQFSVTEKNSLNVASDVTVASGSIAFLYTDPEGKEIFNETFTETKQFDIPLESYGNYRVKVTYEAFKGKYTLNWAK